MCQVRLELTLSRIKSPPLKPPQLLAHYLEDTLHCTLIVGIGVPPTSYLQCIVKVMVNGQGFEPWLTRIKSPPLNQLS